MTYVKPELRSDIAKAYQMLRVGRVAATLLSRGVAKVERMPWENFGGQWRYCYDVVAGGATLDSYYDAGRAEAVADQINANRAAQCKPKPSVPNCRPTWLDTYENGGIFIFEEVE